MALFFCCLRFKIKLNNMRLSKKQKILIIILSLSIIALLNVFQKPARNFFYLISSPIQKKLWRVGDRASDFFAGMFFAEKLEQERERIHLDNQRLLARIIALKELEQENKILREALELGLKEDFALILTEIVGKDISQDFILLDRGFQDGILIDQPVITQQKVVCGKIAEVYKDFSKLALISNKKSSFDVKLEGKPASNAFGVADAGGDITVVAKGKGNQRLVVELIPKGNELEVGDLVQTSALGKIFPGNLLVGKIKKILRSDVEPFQQAEVEIACDIRELEKLFIIIDH